MHRNPSCDDDLVFLTVPDIAMRLGISRRSTYALIASGKLQSTLIGTRSRRVSVTQLRDYVASCEH